MLDVSLDGHFAIDEFEEGRSLRHASVAGALVGEVLLVDLVLRLAVLARTRGDARLGDVNAYVDDEADVGADELVELDDLGHRLLVTALVDVVGERGDGRVPVADHDLPLVEGDTKIDLRVERVGDKEVEHRLQPTQLRIGEHLADELAGRGGLGREAKEKGRVDGRGELLRQGRLATAVDTVENHERTGVGDHVDHRLFLPLSGLSALISNLDSRPVGGLGPTNTEPLPSQPVHFVPRLYPRPAQPWHLCQPRFFALGGSTGLATTRPGSTLGLRPRRFSAISWTRCTPAMSQRSSRQMAARSLKESGFFVVTVRRQ